MTTTPLFRRIRREHVAMMVRGLLWQVLHFRFGFILLRGQGARVFLPRHIELKGIIKIADFSTIDLRNTTQGSIGPNFSLGAFSVFRASGAPSQICPSVVVARSVSFGPYCNIGGGFGLRIGADVISGPYVSIHPEEHVINAGSPVRHQPTFGKGIEIGEDCWLGAKSTILDGSILAPGTVLGANALVAGSKTVADGIYVGIPARKVGMRPIETRGRDEPQA